MYEGRHLEKAGIGSRTHCGPVSWMLRYPLLLSSGIVPAVRLATPTTPAPLLRPDAIGTLAVTPEWRRLGISDQNDEVTGSYSSYPKAQTDESLRGLAPTASSVQLLASQPLSPSQGVGHVDCEMNFRPLVVALLPPNSSFWFYNPSLAQSPTVGAPLCWRARYGSQSSPITALVVWEQHRKPPSRYRSQSKCEPCSAARLRRAMTLAWTL